MSTIYLYLKQHSFTKLLYFGKTHKKSIESYYGSGHYWKRHLNKHGKHVDTLCVWEFDNIEECSNFALKFSKENDIVNSTKYANLIMETGIDFFKPKLNISRKQTKFTCEKISDSRKKLIKEGKIPGNNPPQDLINCNKCGILTTIGNAKRWHFDKCGLINSTNKIWITNGIKNKFVNKDFNIEGGWREGRTHKSAPSQEVLECPKCGFKTTFGNAKRWHFDNCKYS